MIYWSLKISKASGYSPSLPSKALGYWLFENIGFVNPFGCLLEWNAGKSWYQCVLRIVTGTASAWKHSKESKPLPQNIFYVIADMDGNKSED